MIIWTEEFMEDCEAMLQCSMLKEEVIYVQRMMGEEQGYEYASDLEALMDFMVLRHAIDTDNEVTIGLPQTHELN